MTTPPIYLPGSEVREFGSDNTYRWATVTQVSPLRIRLDGDTAALSVTPENLAGALQVGRRVWVQIFGRRLLVLAAVGQDPWHAPTLLNGWVNYTSGGWATAGYRQDQSGKVHLKGLVKSGTVGTPTPIFFVPVELAPEGVGSTAGEMFLQGTNGGMCRMDVYGDGRVAVQSLISGNTGYVTLSGMSWFPAGW